MRTQKRFIKSYVDQKSLVDQDQRIISGVVGSSGIIDRQGESINPKGWSLDNYLKNPVLLWAHDYRSLPIGKALRVYIEQDELKFDLQFADSEIAQDAFNAYKGGFLNAFSVGFIPLKIDDSGEYTFAEQELLELSCVPIPANPEALMGRDAEESKIRIRSIEDKLTAALKTEGDEEEPEENAEVTEDENQQDEPITDETEPENESSTETEETEVAPEEQANSNNADQEEDKSQLPVVTKEGRTLSSKHEKLLRDAHDNISNVLSSLDDEGSQDDNTDDQNRSQPTLNRKALDSLERALKKTDQKVGLTLRLIKVVKSNEKENGEGVSK